jgi:hypothetical protein
VKWHAFIAHIRGLALGAPSLDDALRMATQYGLLRRLNHDGVYHDDALEQALFARVLDRLPAAKALPGLQVLHVLTATSPFGGHTRLALAWLRIRRSLDQQAVVFTRHSDPVTLAALDGMAIPWLCVTGTPMMRLAAIAQQFGSCRIIVLHLHPEDCIGAMAAHYFRARGARVLFVNHADHAFTFGASAAHSVLEISGFGWLTTGRKRQAQTQSFLGIPLPEGVQSAAMPADAAHGSQDRTGPVLSVGAPFKYRPSGGADFAHFLNRLAAAIPNALHLIGPDGTEPWWQALLPPVRARVQFLGLRPPGEVRQRIQSCAAYIDSFPLTGGSAFQEAFMLGAPAFGLRCGIGGYGLVDRLRSDTIGQLVEQIAEALADPASAHALHQRDHLLRQQIWAEFSDAAISARIDRAVAGESAPLPHDLAATAGDLDYFETVWQRQGPSLAIEPCEVPGLHLRLRLLAAFAACRGARIATGRSKLARFALGLAARDD